MRIATALFALALALAGAPVQAQKWLEKPVGAFCFWICNVVDYSWAAQFSGSVR